jgi:hypothetical protein
VKTLGHFRARGGEIFEGRVERGAFREIQAVFVQFGM